MAEFLPSDTEANNLKGEENETPVSSSTPLTVLYCPFCTMPFEYCEYGPCYEERCRPYIQEHHPEILTKGSGNSIKKLTSETQNMKISSDNNEENEGNEDGEGERDGGEGDGEEEKKKKKRGGPKLKKVVELETKVILTKIQRQKRKYVTVVAGLETVPNLKIKDASKLFGKKFSSGASINEGPNGVKEVVIQGDVLLDLPQLLISQFNVLPSSIFFLDGSTLTPYQG